MKLRIKAALDRYVTLEKNMPKANFWIVCTGDYAGMPTKDFSPEHIGVKVAWLPFLSPEVVFKQAQAHFHAGNFRNAIVNGQLTIENFKKLLNIMFENSKK